MFKFIGLIILGAALLGLIAGGVHLYKVAARNKKEMAPYAGSRAVYSNQLGKVLVVYYSLSGHTREIAEKIQAQTGAELYEIKTAEPIGRNWTMYLAVRQQLKKGNYPLLDGELPDFTAYDTVFVGAPVWWYTMATPLWSFLKEADFQGIKVVPFSTQGSNYGAFFEDFAAHARNARLLKSASFNNLPEKYDSAVDNKVIEWLNGL